ncbi:MAG: hypothetical protein LBC41_07935 [Clostridiales bacterium]|nr:hypothetical protein [Clostridiales bacterium]
MEEFSLQGARLLAFSMETGKNMLDMLDDELIGKMFRAVFSEAQGINPPEFTGGDNFAYKIVREQVAQASHLIKSRKVQGANGAQAKKARQEQSQVQSRIPLVANVTWQNAVEAYNLVSDQFPEFPKMRYTLAERKIKAVESIIEEHGVDGINAMLKKATESSFLRGQIPPKNPGEKQFNSCFNWLFSRKHFRAVLSGKYDDWNASKKGVTQESNASDQYRALRNDGDETRLKDIL